MRASPAAALALLLSGCYGYAPAEPATLRPEEEVRVHLTREGVFSLPEILGASGPVLGGRLVSSDGASLLLRVPLTVQVGGLGAQSVPQEVPIAASQLVRVERRSLDRFRTGLALAGVLVGGGAILSGFGVGGPSGADPPKPPTDEEAGSRFLAFLRFALPIP